MKAQAWGAGLEAIRKNLIVFAVLCPLTVLDLPYHEMVGPTLSFWWMFGACTSIAALWGGVITPALAGVMVLDTLLDFGVGFYAPPLGIYRAAMALFGGYLIRRMGNGRLDLSDLKGVTGLVVGGSVIASFTGALGEFIITASMRSVTLATAIYFGISTLSAGASSVLTFSPLIYWLSRNPWQLEKKKKLELALWALLIFILGVLGTTGFFLPKREATILSFFLLPAMVCTAVRLGSAGLAVSVLISNVFSLYGAMEGLGPVQQPNVEDAVIADQAAMFVVDATLIAMVAVIMERQAVQEALRRSLESFQSLFNATFEGLLVHRRGVALNANEALLKAGGYSWGDIFGKQMLGFVHPDDRETVIKNFAQNYHGTYEIRLRRKDGSWMWVEVAARAFGEDKDEARVITVWDLTRRKDNERQLKEQAEQLRQNQKMEAVGRLAGGIAHDFNNLLVGIQGFAELLSMRVDKDSPLRRPVDTILRSAERAADLTQHLLNFSRKGASARETVEVHRVLTGVKNLLEHCLDKRIKLRIRLNAEHDTVIADPALLESAVLNLAINAGDAMPEGGILTIKTSVVREDTPRALGRAALSQGEWFCLEVEDTGMGMDKETLERCFEPFFTTKPVGRGTGLGLATVFGFVAGHEGALDVKSELGKGTRFSLYLPVSGLPAQAPVQTPVSVQVKGHGKVLVVDDEAHVRELLVASLQELGFDVIAVENGEEAVAALKQGQTFVLTVLDMVMPGLGGKATLERLRLLAPEMPVLICSGFSGDTFVTPAGKSGIIRVLPKPFRFVELQQALINLLPENGRGYG